MVSCNFKGPLLILASKLISGTAVTEIGIMWFVSFVLTADASAVFISIKPFWQLRRLGRCIAPQFFSSGRKRVCMCWTVHLRNDSVSSSFLDYLADEQNIIVSQKESVQRFQFRFSEE